MRGSPNCTICGYGLNPIGGGGTVKIPRTDELMSAFAGRVHIGCFIGMAANRKKTFEMLKS